MANDVISGNKLPLNLHTELHTQPEQYFIQKGEERVLHFFHEMAARVPAYREFLLHRNIDSHTIKTHHDFKSIPPVDKQNYIRAYSLEDLCWDGNFKSQSWTISSTSGSTGEPVYFPRQELQDEVYANMAEHFLLTNFKIDKKSTLFIVGFPLGVWIGGIFTFKALSLIASRGSYPLSIITAGINKAEILKAIKNLGHHFDQVILGSYGPFLKDIIDDGESYGIEWKDYTMKFVFAAEGFSETFRDYVVKKAGLNNVYVDTLNIYGTVDLGTMAHETPLSILIRRLALNDTGLYSRLFGEHTKLPTLCQYNPVNFYFEEHDGNLYCTSQSGLPLVRYDLKDHGGVITMEQMRSIFEEVGYDLISEIQKASIEETIWNLPFVYVYERSDFSVSFFAFQIYPETIRKALQDASLEAIVTGKFTMLVTYDADANQVLEIHIELKRGVEESADVTEKILMLVTNTLLNESSEYRKTHEEFPDKTIPRIICWPYESETHFRPGGKQKWVK